MDFEPRENEVVIETLEKEKDWYAVRHGRKFEWSKSMFRFELLRKLVLTNQRIVFLKDAEIDYDASRIEEVEMKGKKMSKEEVKRHVDRAMEVIRADPFVQKYMANETKCLKCGHNVFQVERMSPEQVMLTCNNCGAPHLIDAQLDKDRAVLTFWSPKMEE